MSVNEKVTIHHFYIRLTASSSGASIHGSSKQANSKHEKLGMSTKPKGPPGRRKKEETPSSPPIPSFFLLRAHHFRSEREREVWERDSITNIRFYPEYNFQDTFHISTMQF